MTEEEVVLTSRRARWRAPRGAWESGRLRLSDRRLLLVARDGTVTEVAVAAVSSVRVTRWPRPTLVLDLGGDPLRLRCFAVPAVAALLLP